MVDHALGRLRPAAADGQVVLAELFGHQAAAQGRRRVAIEGQQQAAAGGAVEPVHQENRPAELFAQPVGGEIGFAARQLAVVDHQAGGFVDHRELVVGVDDRQPYVLFAHRRGQAARKAPKAPRPAMAAAAGMPRNCGPPASSAYNTAATIIRPVPRIA